MTMPVLIANHQKKAAVSKLKKAYSTLSQMLISSYADNGPVEFSSSDSVNAEDTENFFNTYWLPYFSAPKVANSHFYDTVYPYYNINKTKNGSGIYTDYSLGRISFSTKDNIFYYVSVMRWNNHDENGEVSDPRYGTEQNVIVDINGLKLPNTFGKDVFAFYVDFSKNSVFPKCYSSASFINNNCSKTGAGDCCAAKIMRDGWQMANDYPW